MRRTTFIIPGSSIVKSFVVEGSRCSTAEALGGLAKLYLGIVINRDRGNCRMYRGLSIALRSNDEKRFMIHSRAQGAEAREMILNAPSPPLTG